MPNCCVLGSGKLGSRIAGELAIHGHRVKVYDQNALQVGQVPFIISEQIRNLTQQGLTTADQSQSFVNNIKICRTLADAVTDVDFIFEAVSENLATKKFLYQKITHICGSQTIIGSNTISLKIEDFTEDVLFSERIIGIRFLYPVYCIPLVEYTAMNNTDPHVINTVKVFFDAMAKKIFRRSNVEKPKHLSAEEVGCYEETQRCQIAQQQLENTHAHHGSQRGLILPNRSQDPDTPTTELMHGHNNTHHNHGHGIAASHDISNTQIMELVSGHNKGYQFGHGIQGSENNCTIETCTTEHPHGSNKCTATAPCHSVPEVGCPTCPANSNHKMKLQPPLSQPNSGPQSRTECVVCEEDDINTVLLPCRHMWLCFACAKILQGHREPCPACRSPIEDVIAVYKP